MDEITQSKFNEMEDDNFYTLQEDWKVEIDERLLEIREKEKELRSLEAELDDKQREQRMAEERLKQREAELEQREIDLLQRELNMMIQQHQGVASGSNVAPTPKKRKGHFKKSKLKLGSSTSIISAPSGRTIIDTDTSPVYSPKLRISR